MSQRKGYPASPTPAQCKNCRMLHMITKSRAHCCKFGDLAVKTESHCRNVGGFTPKEKPDE